MLLFFKGKTSHHRNPGSHRHTLVSSLGQELFTKKVCLRFSFAGISNMEPESYPRTTMVLCVANKNGCNIFALVAGWTCMHVTDSDKEFSKE